MKSASEFAVETVLKMRTIPIIGYDNERQLTIYLKTQFETAMNEALSARDADKNALLASANEIHDERPPEDY